MRLRTDRACETSEMAWVIAARSFGSVRLGIWPMIEEEGGGCSTSDLDGEDLEVKDGRRDMT